jgi:hypothetical protein
MGKRERGDDTKGILRGGWECIVDNKLHVKYVGLEITQFYIQHTYKLQNTFIRLPLWVGLERLPSTPSLFPVSGQMHDTAQRSPVFEH